MMYYPKINGIYKRYQEGPDRGKFVIGEFRPARVRTPSQRPVVLDVQVERDFRWDPLPPR